MGPTRSTSYSDRLSHERLGYIGLRSNGRVWAKAEPGFDNRVAFQAAIDTAYGVVGVVYVPLELRVSYHKYRDDKRKDAKSSETNQDFKRIIETSRAYSLEAIGQILNYTG